MSPIDLIKNSFLNELEKINQNSIDDNYNKWLNLINNLSEDYSIQERFLRHFYNAYKNEETINVKGRTKALRSNLIEIYDQLIKRDAINFFYRLYKSSEYYNQLINPHNETKQIYIDRPPYYHSFFKGSLNKIDYSIFPVQVEEQRNLFSPSLKPFAIAANNFLHKNFSESFITQIDLLKKEMPEVKFGDERVLFEEDDKEETASYEMMLLVKHPSKTWKQKWQELKLDKPYSLLITISLSGYQPKMKNWKGSKEIRLGTNNKVDLPWLTSLDEPLPVIQFTGALIDAEGNLLRAGAEGFYFKKGSFISSVLGMNEIFSKEDIKKAIFEFRREDLQDKPLAWQVALKRLIKSLTTSE